MRKLLNNLKKEKKLLKLSYCMIGILLSSLIYNIIFVPNHIVTGGVSGLAIIIQELTGLNTTIFIDISNAILIIMSFIFLGKKDTFKQLFGCVLYPLAITLTAPLAQIVTINIDDKLIVYILAAIIYGLANGIVYRPGYSTGGSDIITAILSKKMKKPITSIALVINFIIIISSGIIFSPVLIMYELMIVFISNKITNSVLFSISTTKMVYVISEKNKDIEKYIMDEIHTGATEIKIHSGLFNRRKQMLLCILHNTQYNKFKQKILSLDSKAFILANKCYEVSGGIKRTILPF